MSACTCICARACTEERRRVAEAVRPSLEAVLRALWSGADGAVVDTVWVDTGTTAVDALECVADALGLDVIDTRPDADLVRAARATARPDDDSSNP